VHLDVSYCEIDESDTIKIAKALKLNQTIYGLHYQGNAGFIDFKGHLHVLRKEQQQHPLSIRTGLIQRISSVNIIPNYYHRQMHSGTRNICWICEGWSEKYFKINKGPNEKGCFLHLDF
jgi:NLR family CARD domain-containing protein 3